MAYDQELADRIRSVLAGHEAITEKKMFGGLSFMLGGRMCCGVIKDDLVVRVGADSYDAFLAEPHARPMDFTGRPLKWMVYVGPEGYQTDESLGKWVNRAVDFAASLQQ